MPRHRETRIETGPSGCPNPTRLGRRRLFSPATVPAWTLIGAAVLLPAVDVVPSHGEPQPIQGGAGARAFQESSITFWLETDPSVVWCDDPGSTFSVRVHIEGRSDIEALTLTLSGPSPAVVPLADDGLGADAVAGDQVFSAAGLTVPCFEPALKYGRSVGTWIAPISGRLKDGSPVDLGFVTLVAMVHPRFKGVFDVASLAPGLSATAYAFFIEDNRHEVIDSYPVSEVYCGKSNFNAYRKLYSVLPDVFDIAMVMPGLTIVQPATFLENVPYTVLVSNSVRHIGLPILDDTAKFGSAGKLKSVIYQSFGTIQIFDHEIAHTWGAAIGSSLGLLDPTDFIHWSQTADISGQLSSYVSFPGGAVGTPARVDDDTWRMRPNSENVPYAPLELYVMGLIPPEEVPPIHILRDVRQTDPSRDPAALEATVVRTVTIDDILRAEGGPRDPAHTESQKDFRAAFIVTQPMPYTDAAYAYFSLLSYTLMSKDPPEENDNHAPFYWASGGRATIDTRLPVDLPEPQGLPGQPIPTPEATSTLAEVPAATARPTAPEPTVPTVDDERPAGLLSRCGLPLGALLAVGLTSRRRRRAGPIREKRVPRP